MRTTASVPIMHAITQAAIAILLAVVVLGIVATPFMAMFLILFAG